MRAIHFSRRQNSRDHTDQNRGEENVAPRIINFFRQRGDSVETDISKHGDRRSVKDAVHRECLRVVERLEKERFRKLRDMKNVADRIPEKCQNHRSHDGAERGVDARRSFYAAQVKHGKQPRENQRPNQPRIRNLKLRPAQQISHGLRAPDGANQRVDHVIHGHAPASDVAERRMQLAPYIRVRRPRAGIHPRHAAVAHGRKNHGDHRDQNGRDHVSLAGVAEYAISGHGRRGLNDDDAVKNQVPKRERSAQTWSGMGSCRGRVFHGSGYSIMDSRNCQY